ncbi:MAG: hypothetical protein LV480_12935 [Methylacidiphilales bacterium]|nr:hypothetical protein [Candidatus Methylacidiphilales bacterium]
MEDTPGLPEESPSPSGASRRFLPGWMLKPFQFVSLAFLTQGVLLLNQIVLLPIQIRIWGTEITAYWYSTLAVAAVTTAADFGLRTAGHAELIRFVHDSSDREARTDFEHLWAWIRILIASTTFLLVAVDFIYNHFYLGAAYPLWRPALLIGIALEILIVVRVMYLDTLGLYREAEAGYLILAAARLFLAVGALLFFHAPPATLAWIWFFTGIFSIAQQGRISRRLGLLRLFEPIPRDLSFKSLAITRHTMADPCSSWVRINGPVVILTVIAPAAAITTYVALRAVFGAARTTISQLSRYASVEYLTLRQSRRFDLAEIQITLCVLLAAFFASGITVAVLADNGRIASLLLRKVDGALYQEMAITFGLGSAFYSYQIMQAVIRRAGEVARIANRQYVYMLCSVVFAIVALVTKSTLLWLVLSLLADIMISVSFLLKTSRESIQSQTSAGWRGCVAAAASSLLVLAIWLVARFENFGFLRETTASAIACTVVFLLLWLLLIAAVDFCLVYGLLAAKMSPVGSLVERLRSLRTAQTAK